MIMEAGESEICRVGCQARELQLKSKNSLLQNSLLLRDG